MGLFGGGALRRQIEALSIEMESLREEATKATD